MTRNPSFYQFNQTGLESKKIYNFVQSEMIHWVSYNNSNFVLYAFLNKLNNLSILQHYTCI